MGWETSISQSSYHELDKQFGLESLIINEGIRELLGKQYVFEV